MHKLRIMLQENAGDDSRPRWFLMHSAVITEDTSAVTVKEILSIIERQINSAFHPASE